MKRIFINFAATAVFITGGYGFAEQEEIEEPVTIAVQGGGIDTVVEVPKERAGEGPHVKGKNKAPANQRPEKLEIRGNATETIEVGTEKQIGNVRVRIPPTRVR